MKTSPVSILLSLGLIIAAARAQNPPVPRPPPEVAIFAGGCFWCIQPSFDKTPGVIKTVVGYCGGTEPNPKSEAVKSGKTKYRESIEITYDPAAVSYEQLLDIYWRQIDPTQADGQFTDIGQSYRAAIFYRTEQEKKIAEISKEKLARSGKFDKPIVTEILPATKFYPAEADHQKYYQKHPKQFAAFGETSGRTSFREKKWSERH
jgi:peptide methionine sulfoxide reductase msrA/msrB